MKHFPANALRKQLGQAQSAGPHPDADQLTAFTEEALPDRERADVLAHLAACASCRAVLHAATVAEPEVAVIPQPRPARIPRRIWIPGIAVAASLLVIAASSILVDRATRTNPVGPSTTASAPAVLASQPLSSTPAPPAVAPPEPRAKAPAPKRARTPIAPRTPAPPPPATETVTVSNAPMPLTTTQGDTSAISLGSVATRGAPSIKSQEQAQAEVMQRRSALAAKVTPEAAAQVQDQRIQDQRIQGQRIQDQRAFAGEFEQSVHGAFMARPALRPRFRINGQGQIERATEAGAWQPVAVGPVVHFRVVSVAGTGIWAGGDQLRLFHSLDNGVTWLEVPLPASADRAHAIIHIRIESPQKLTVEADDGMTWISIDGGVTWQ
ncbi:MAG TPA: zf-HC2 domain-containing protein [Acidobacteriaceae bacterium]|nr:zf-HC2 domain-containing protein [Acidobacteriaceae bacterium]